MRPSAARTLAIGLAVLTASLAGSAPRAHAGEELFPIEMKGIRFSPEVLRVNPGDTVTLRVFNNETSDVPHTLELDAFNVHLGNYPDNPILPGENITASFVADRAGVFYFYCAVPGHAQNVGGGRWTGMAGRLEVGAVRTPDNPAPIIVGGILLLALAWSATRRKKD